MKPITAHKTDIHNRVIQFRGLKDEHVNHRLNVELRYRTNEEDGATIDKAVALDNEVIPAIFRAFDLQTDLLAACKALLRIHYDTGNASVAGLEASNLAETAIAKATSRIPIPLEPTAEKEPVCPNCSRIVELCNCGVSTGGVVQD